MGFELEKKFLLDKMPEGLGEPVLIRQAYLYTDPFELRVRKRGAQCFITYKGAGDEERVEWEKEIPGWLYTELVTKRVGRIIIKNRYNLEREGHLYEFDEYLDELEGLFIVEIEFKNRKDFDSFQIQAWLGNVIDVTQESEYKNKNLATKEWNGIKNAC